MPNVQQADLNSKCPECGAANRPGMTRCWMCGADLEDQVLYAELVPEVDAASHWQFALSELFALVAVVAIIAGIWVQDPGSGLALAIIVTPAVVVTLIRTARKRGRREAVTWTDRIVTFLLTAAATFGAILLLSAAVVVALLVYCFYALANMNV